MIDYTKTSDGLFAYRYPRASVTADAVLFAERELEEETGIVLTGMQLVGIYSDVERDPRGRVITAAYTAMTAMPEAKAADDAAAAKWWPLDALPKLAFDHETILREAMKVLEIKRY